MAARPSDIAGKSSRFIVMASVCVVVAALYFAQEVLIPLALSLLLCFLLAPLVTRLERYRVGRAPAVVLVVCGVATVLVLLGWVVTAQMLNLADRLPEYQGEIVAKVERAKARFGGGGGVTEKLGQVAKEIEQATTRPATQPTTQDSTRPAEASAATAPAAPRPPKDPVRQLVDDPVGAAAREVTSSPPKEAPPAGTTKTNPLWVVALPAPVSPVKTLGAYVGYVASPLGTAGLVLVFVVFILIQREDLRDRMIRLVGHQDLNVTTTALDDAAGRISRYLMAQAIVNGTYGVAIAVGLWLIGHFVGGAPFPSFVIWGLLCAVLRFIPYIGPWIASIFPITLSLAVYHGFGVFIWTTGLFVFIELLSNNLMEPYLYGASTGMSTVAVLVSAVFWTWLWGPVGLLMATPLTVVLVVIGKYVPQMRFLDILLGDEPVLEPPERVYQRLLAMDQEEATELARDYLKEMDLERVYDEVLNPALSLAEQDRHRGRLDEQRQVFIRRALRDMIEELGDEWRLRQDRTDAEAMKSAAAVTVAAAKGTGVMESGSAPVLQQLLPAALTGDHGTDNGAMPGGNGHPAAAAPDAPDTPEERAPAVRVPKDCTVNVVITPAHDEADEISGLMLAQVLEFRGYCAFAQSVTKLASELVEAVETKGAHVVVVSAMPPAAVAHSRYLCKRLHARFPEINMVVGLWTMRGDVKKAKDRVTCIGTVQVATTFKAALEQVGQMAQPVIVAADAARTAAPAPPNSPVARPAAAGHSVGE
jgi:predicted PurR-regulated permease PerM